MRKSRSGFTMAELIIVLLVMSILGFIAFNKLFGTKTKQEIENGIKSDLEVITAAGDKFRLNTRDGKYSGLSVSRIMGQLPKNMVQMDATGANGNTAGTYEWVGSITFGEMCRYTVASNSGDNDRTFNIGLSCEDAQSNLGWTDNEMSLVEQTFWEYINRKYGYSATKGLVDPATFTDASSMDSGLAGADLATDVPPTSSDIDGVIYATDIRGF